MADYGIDMQSGRVWWLYQARRALSQTGAGGGALRARISVASGQTARLVSALIIGTASAGNVVSVSKRDEDANISVYLASATAGASRLVSLPAPGANPALDNVANSYNMMLGPGEFLSFDSSAALNTEAMTVAVVLLLSTSTEPTWDTTGSAGTPSLAASTISAANTLQAVVL